MHARQPMQASRSRSTMPSARFSSAFTGQIVTHGAFEQWLQRNTAKWRFTAGKRPFSWYLTHVRKLPTGTSFSALHATVHAWQPMQRRWSIRKPYCMRCRSRGVRRGRPARRETEPQREDKRARDRDPLADLEAARLVVELDRARARGQCDRAEREVRAQNGRLDAGDARPPARIPGLREHEPAR